MANSEFAMMWRRGMIENQSTAMALVYCPCPTLEEAKRLGNALLDAKLAGCINILPGMVSLYDWKGAREEAAEAVLIAKTSEAAAARVREFLQREHPYEVPAILTLALADVNASYRDWLMQGIA
jgi:periplasmic divalent cation tolerance protein